MESVQLRDEAADLFREASEESEEATEHLADVEAMRRALANLSLRANLSNRTAANLTADLQQAHQRAVQAEQAVLELLNQSSAIVNASAAAAAIHKMGGAGTGFNASVANSSALAGVNSTLLNALISADAAEARAQNSSAEANASAANASSQEANASAGLLHEEHEEEELNRTAKEMAKDAVEQKGRSTIEERVCAADVSGVLSSFNFVIAFLSAAVSECPALVNQQAYCSSDLTRMFASLAEASAGAASISAFCTPLGMKFPTLPSEDIGRRLGDATAGDGDATLRNDSTGVPRELQSSVERQREEAECAVDIVQGITLLGQASLEIHAAREHCPDPDGDDQKERSERRCGVTSLASFGAFSLAAFMMSNAAEECAGTLNTDANCASGISQLFAGVVELAAAASSLAEACTSIPPGEEGPEDYVIR